MTIYGGVTIRVIGDAAFVIEDIPRPTILARILFRMLGWKFERGEYILPNGKIIKE